jgi:photosystem II stability/assembly factor-like uncharacterized protein
MVVLVPLLHPTAALSQSIEFDIIDSIAIADPAIRGGNWQYDAIRRADDGTYVGMVNTWNGAYSSALRVSRDDGMTWRSVLLQHRDLVVHGNEWMNGVRLTDIAIPGSRLWMVIGDSTWVRFDTSVSPPVPVDTRHSFLYRSADGGNTWQPVKVADSTSLFVSLTMADAHNGIIVALDRLYRTTDGGATWTVLPYPPVPAMYLRRLWMFTPLHYRSFVYDDARQNYILLETRDGGESWTRESVAEGNEPERVFFLDADRGWMAWRMPDADQKHLHNAIKKTTDGGRTWTTQWEEEHGYPGGLLRVSFVDGDHGFAGGRGGEFLYTSDGGLHWRRHDSLFFYDIPTLGESPDIVSIAAIDSRRALFGMSTTKLVRYDAAAASLPSDDRDARIADLCLSPNPVTGALHIVGTVSRRGDIRVVDMLGRIVYRMPASDAASTGWDIDVTGLRPGAYMVVLEENGRIATARFVRR